MKLKAIITSAFFIGALFTGAAFAADTGTQDAPERDRGLIGTPEQRPQQRDQQTGWFQEDRIPGMHRAENLMGENVNDQQGNNLGSIDDLVLSQDGQVDFIIMSRGGVLGVGADQVAIPWEAANLQRGADDQLMADITEQQLEGAPAFDDYAQFQDQQYEQQVHSYFGTEPRADREFQPGMQPDTQRDQQYQQPGQDRQQPGTTN